MISQAHETLETLKRVSQMQNTVTKELAIISQQLEYQQNREVLLQKQALLQTL